jgi:uncharacterized membrane protein
MTTTTTRRLVTLDRVRGLAIVLMVLDHALLAAGHHGGPVRLTVTRLALPLFGLTAGALWKPGRARRYLEVAGAAIIATGLGLVVGIGQPDILWLLLVAMLVMPAGPALAAAGAIQATTWPLRTSGYEPGVVLVLVVLGHLYGSAPLDRLGQRLPHRLEGIGRHPLGWYLGHLALLAVLKVTF